MRKLLLSAITLFLFSTSIFVFQVSCQKDAMADANERNSNDKIVYVKSYGATPSDEIWIMNLDGTDNKKVPIDFPFDDGSLSLSGDATGVTVSKDGKKIIFSLYIEDEDKSQVYTCNIDGTNLTKILEENPKRTYSKFSTF
jgi:Tol biopolymer transport system component